MTNTMRDRFEEPITISEFCSRNEVTGDERKELAYRLASMRSKQVLEHFGINLMKELRDK